MQGLVGHKAEEVAADWIMRGVEPLQRSSAFIL